MKGKSFDDILAAIAPPKFDHECTRCRAAILRAGLCLDCTDAQRAARDAVLATRASMPERFAWAPGLTAPALSERVDPDALAQARALDLARLDRVGFPDERDLGVEHPVLVADALWGSC